jgi:hypothetical protein
MVIFKNYSRFFARSGASNFQLDVHQLRRAFLSGPQTAERIRRLHADRLVRIVAREGLGQVLAGPVITFHAIPFAAAEGVAETVNLGELIAPRSGVALRPLGEPSLGFSPRFNSNGLISERRLRHNEVAGYLQVFRDGVIESVDAFSIAGHVSVGGKAGMVALQTARDLLMAVDSLGPIIRTLPLPLPIAVIVTVIGAAGLPLIRSDGTFVYSSATIDSDHWLLPDVVISETYVDAGRLLRPVFDGIWQAAGQSACPHYDASGQWNGGY